MIESLQNKIIKEIKSLNLKKERDKNSLFIIEGERIINEIPKYFNIKYYLISETYSKNKDIKKLENRAKVYIAKDDIFKKVSDTVNPQGILAVCEQYNYNLEEILKKKNPFFIILEEISDPGNLGTIIRTSDAGGADAIFLSTKSVDLYNSKTVRSTMGSIFNIPIFQNINLNLLIDKLKKRNILTLSAHLSGITYPYDIDLNVPLAILIGNEANGLKDSTVKITDKLVKIPIVGKAESINASVACGILIYEVVRQRLNN